MANLGQNGFFHERPSDYWIDIVPEMRQHFGGVSKINWHVDGQWLTADFKTAGYVFYNGVCYFAQRYTSGDFPGADYWYQIEGLIEKPQFVLPHLWNIGGIEAYPCLDEEEALNKIVNRLNLTQLLVWCRKITQEQLQIVIGLIDKWEIKPEIQELADSFLTLKLKDLCK